MDIQQDYLEFLETTKINISLDDYMKQVLTIQFINSKLEKYNREIKKDRFRKLLD